MTFDEWWEIYEARESFNPKHRKYKDLLRTVWEQAVEFGDSPPSGVLESYPAPQWRDDPPEQEGWFSYRAKPSHAQRILKVSWTHDNKMLRVMARDGYLPVSELDADEAQWAGPRREPREPDEATGAV